MRADSLHDPSSASYRCPTSLAYQPTKMLERPTRQHLPRRHRATMVRRPLSARTLGGLVVSLCISAFVLSGCVINDAGALAREDALENVNIRAPAAARIVHAGVARGAGDLDEIAFQVAKDGVMGFLVTEPDYPNLTRTSASVVAIDNGTDLTVTVLVRGGGQAAVGFNAVRREVHGCFDLVFIDGQPKEPEKVNVRCPKWTREILVTSAEIELARFPARRGQG